MATFIYYFGAFAFAITATRAIWRVIDYLENGGRKK